MAFQAAQAHDLSRTDGKTDIFRSPGDPQALYVQQDLSRRDSGAVGIDVAEGPAHHHGDHPVLGDIPTFQLTGVLAVLEHGHPVRQMDHFFQPVRDVNDTYALISQLQQNGEQSLDLFFAERGGRLVHNEKFRLTQYRTGNLSELLICQLQATNLGVARSRTPLRRISWERNMFSATVRLVSRLDS